MKLRNSWAEGTFRRKYAQGKEDTWDKLAERVVDDVCLEKLDKTSKHQLTEYIKDQKFLPGGRYLYYAGRKLKYYNNCFSGDTKVLTKHGWREVQNIGDTEVLSPVDGRYYPAPFISHGKQDLYKYIFATKRGHQKHTWEVKATRTHRWILEDGTDTYDLRVGDTVPANKYSVGYDSLGFVHGFIFGDGTSKGQLRLCCDKDKKYLQQLTQVEHTLTYPEFAKGDPSLYFPQKVDWKNLPAGQSPAYISSFIAGWLAADGSETAGNKLCSVNKEAVEWFREYAPYAGLVITGNLRFQVRDVTLGEYYYPQHKIYIQNYSYGEDFSGYKLISITPIGQDEVYCPFEEIHNQIVIEHGIHTGNCYLLKAEEDTREEWANIVWRAMSCLTTGGGIGIDYSVLRASGSTLSRTGGTASGPIPLMAAVNEIGRNVMQGGSRRSAIYASLNWQHGDAEAFLKAKNWSPAVRELREKDFSFPAALDMTNISLNYDDQWLNRVDRERDNTFVENCKQAMRTGEPGFSFNFGDKENETLRNACTEVTSEDDSDVCNLGSINIGNIDDINSFRSIVNLASKFLVCGTLRADLPYRKVFQVRGKNRRLGLGLMGIHEWLLKRGYGYEVVDELRTWLEVYRTESKRAADEHCDRLSISHPVAYRAIAPTGTIGILAATTTGIEPLFACAYKRRFLESGTKWKYQYVIDGVADRLIHEYGLDPDSIDTAYSLSHDYEKRIKFQAGIQDFVDMSISSTINLPRWGSENNNEDKVPEFAECLARYAPRLRGFTCYPNGGRGGQPLTEVSYTDALKHKDVVYDETPDICDLIRGGSCGA